MNNKSTNKKIIRGIIYITGLLTLALGIILNTKAGLGVSPIISVSYSISQIMKINFGNMTFILFTRFMNLFSAYIPNFEEDMLGTVWGTMPVRVLVLLVAIVLTGVGAAMSLDMRIIPNPGDGIVQAISDFVCKDVGLVKNCFDVFNICLTTVMCLVFIGHIVGIGIGTVIAVIGVGRVIAAFNFVFMKKFVKLEIE